MNQHSPKVLFLTGSMGRGGAERVISLLTKCLSNEHIQTQIGLLLFNNVDYELDNSTKVFDFTSKKKRIFSIFYWIKKIKKHIKEEKPDVVIAFSARIGILSYFSTIGLKTKLIISERNDPRKDGRSPFLRFLTKIIYPRVFRIVLQTESSYSFFSKRIQKKSVVIPNPVFTTKAHVEAGSNKIVNVARLEPQKNQKLLIDAFSIIHAKYPNYTLHIFGDGSLKQTLIDYSISNGINEFVYFHGNVPNVTDQIFDADIFVLSSDYEGQSNALLEALCSGIPVITSNCSGTDDIIDKNNALLFEVGNKKQLVDALLLFISNDRLRKQCGENAKSVFDNHNPEKIIDKWKQTIFYE